MEPHHEHALTAFLDRYRDDTTILAVLLAGSLAHGFAQPDSDVDLILVVTEAEHQARQKAGKLAFSVWDLCQYPGGYVDVKVTAISVLQTIADRGSDPARYAFQDARIAFSRTTGLEPLLAAVVRFPVDQKESRRHRFVSQLLAWKWYFSQGEQKRSPYLIHLATQKLVLFASRIILNENERLYPYHKWLLKEAQIASRKPPEFDALVSSLAEAPEGAKVAALVSAVLDFLVLSESQIDWPSQFLVDSELNWLTHEAPIDDL